MTYAFTGLMVLYRLTEEEALATNKQREDALRHTEAWEGIAGGVHGYQMHIGNPVSEGDTVSMTVTRVWPDSVNGQATLDGNDCLWIVSVSEGDQPGEWQPITNG